MYHININTYFQFILTPLILLKLYKFYNINCNAKSFFLLIYKLNLKSVKIKQFQQKKIGYMIKRFHGSFSVKKISLQKIICKKHWIKNISNSYMKIVTEAVNDWIYNELKPTPLCSRGRLYQLLFSF